MNSLGDILTIIFGLTAAVLTLVGLMSIFISLNTQHSIQRCREILWDLSSYPYGDIPFSPSNKIQSVGKELFQKVYIYEQALSLDKHKDSISRRMINFCTFTIGITIMIFILTSGLFARNNSIKMLRVWFVVFSTIIIILLMVNLILFLRDLKNTSKAGKLPPVNELLDGDNLEYGMNIPHLAAISSKIYIEHDELLIGLPLPFENLQAKAILYFDYESNQAREKIQVGPIKLNTESNILPRENLYWYRFNIPAKQPSEVILVFSSKQSQVNSYYKTSQGMVEAETFKWLYDYFPTTVKVVASNRDSILDPMYQAYQKFMNDPESFDPDDEVLKCIRHYESIFIEKTLHVKETCREKDKTKRDNLKRIEDYYEYKKIVESNNRIWDNLKEPEKKVEIPEMDDWIQKKIRSERELEAKSYNFID